MLKKSIRFPLIYFVALTVWQLIFKKDIEWIKNIGVCFIMLLFISLYNWAQKPYEWKKEK
ncbi:hypothetical protein [Neobacillus mesonae]|uniref:Uncharacterized protein n=1 Tax=Neobacillus mesonae TaxID=1193713 RepID=A0A3T0HZL1_9BACI|nr:hypothetical protein [Neobacillus mesonae]AZU62509.1 hypothetical protein CHR53_15165 [Neobacillus mesonae]